MKLRYVGEQPVAFLTGGVGEVQPGGTFSVPAEIAKRFLARDDIEAVEVVKPRNKTAEAE